MIDYPLILTINYPGKQWSYSGDTYEGLEWLDSSPKPTQAELDALAPSSEDEQAKKICKQKASDLLYATDWTTIPDVVNTVNNPYLTNQAEFITYRNTVRGLAVNPVANPTFPTVPTAQWSS